MELRKPFYQQVLFKKAAKVKDLPLQDWLGCLDKLSTEIEVMETESI